MQPVKRTDLFDAYWRFAAERQAIFFHRLDGAAAPWTDDPILRAYKFCNAYRASDRVSQFLIRQVIYGPGLSPEDVILRVILFRLFSRIATWRRLIYAHGAITAKSFDAAAFGDTLDLALSAGEAIYTNAFILSPGGHEGQSRKHRHHLALIEQMTRGGLAGKIARARDLGALYELLLPYPMIGPFLAYQLAIDINYSELTDFDEDAFTKPGPGAARGIRKCFDSPGSWSAERIIHTMVERQDDEFSRLGLDFQTLWGRRLHAIDCQNLFCELDKYARIAFPDLVSNRTRIKTAFVPSAEPISYFYPPKWGINHLLTSSVTPPEQLSARPR